MVPYKPFRISLVLCALLVIIEADGKKKESDNNGKNESGATETKGDENDGEKKQSDTKAIKTCKGEGDECVAGQCCVHHVCYPYEEGGKKVRKCKKEHIPESDSCLEQTKFCDPSNNQCCDDMECYTAKSRYKISLCRKKQNRKIDDNRRGQIMTQIVLPTKQNVQPKLIRGCRGEGGECYNSDNCCMYLICHTRWPDLVNKYCMTRAAADEDEFCLKTDEECWGSIHPCCKGLNCRNNGYWSFRCLDW